jgi:hypothetical protein
LFVQQGFEVKNIKAFHRETGRVQTTGLESNTVYNQEQGGFTTTKLNTQDPLEKSIRRPSSSGPRSSFFLLSIPSSNNRQLL